MSWTSDPNNAGFSAVPPFRELSANSTTQNVELEAADGASLLSYYDELMTLRKDYPVIGAGLLEVKSQGGDPLLLLTRNSASECAVIVINYSNQNEVISATTPCLNGTFNIVLGGSGTAISDGFGTIVDTIAARSAVVYHAIRT